MEREMQTLYPRSDAARHLPGLERVEAVVEAALGYVPEDTRDLIRVYRGLMEGTYKLMVVIQREDEPEPSVIEIRCLEPHGDVEKARRLGLLLEVGGRSCVVYPG